MKMDTFNRLLFARATSLLGDAIFMMGLPLYIYHYTGSEQSFGLSFGLEMATYMIFSFAGGQIADSYPLKKTLIALDIFRGLLVLMAGIILSYGFNLYLCLGLIIILSSTNAVYNISFDKLPITYLDGLQLSKILSYFQSMNQAVHIVGAPIAGVIMSLSKGSFIFYLNAATFLLPLFVLITFPNDDKVPVTVKQKKSVIKEAFKGLTNLWEIPEIRYTTFLSSALNIVLAIYFANWAVLFKSEMGMSDQFLGIPHAVGAIAFLITSIYLGRTISSKTNHYFSLLILSQIVGITAGLLIPFIDSIPLLIAVTSLLNIAASIHTLPSTLIRKEFCPLNEYGKILGATRMVARFFTPIAVGISVFFLKWFTVKEIILAGTVITIILSIYPIKVVTSRLNH